jgi:hypothetical protein
MVEVFKTNVKQKKKAFEIIASLQMILPDAKINFDLDDCDKILRIEGELINPNLIVNKLKSLKIQFEFL